MGTAGCNTNIGLDGMQSDHAISKKGTSDEEFKAHRLKGGV
jgi:hypothetical protein